MVTDNKIGHTEAVQDICECVLIIFFSAGAIDIFDDDIASRLYEWYGLFDDAYLVLELMGAVIQYDVIEASRDCQCARDITVFGYVHDCAHGPGCLCDEAYEVLVSVEKAEAGLAEPIEPCVCRGAVCDSDFCKLNWLVAKRRK